VTSVRRDLPAEAGAYRSETTGDLPAVGLVATPDNSRQVPAAILRARQHGHEVFVAARAPDCEGVDFARALGAVIVLPSEEASGAASPREELVRASRAKGYPGLIYQADPGEQVDFGASEQELAATERFAVDATPEPSVDPELRTLVGIPAYNEAGTIGEVVRTAARHACEVLVVDDGSDDGTAREARAAGATVVGHDRNSGYGAALKTLFEQAARSDTDHLVVLDADGQHDASDIPELVARQRESGARVVIGSRFGDGADTEMPLYRRVGLLVVNLLTNASLGAVSRSSRVRDTQSGFRAYDRVAIESIADDDTIGDRMSASTDILYHAHSRGYDVEEVPTTIDYDVDDGSSVNPIQHGIVLVMNILRKVERERPITLLGLPGVGCVLVGFGFGYWTVIDYVRSGSFAVGLAITTSVFVTVGMLAAFTAIILHSLEVYRE
jgi:hypothetical protein